MKISILTPDNHPEEAQEIGWKAREKCIAEYSYDAIEKVLVSIFSKHESQFN